MKDSSLVSIFLSYITIINGIVQD